MKTFMLSLACYAAAVSPVAAQCGTYRSSYVAPAYYPPVTQVVFAIPAVFVQAASYTVGLSAAPQPVGIYSSTVGVSAATGGVGFSAPGAVAASGAVPVANDSAATIAALQARIAQLEGRAAPAASPAPRNALGGGASAGQPAAAVSAFESAVGGSCIQCHSQKDFAAKGGGINLEGDWNSDLVKKVARQVSLGKMPPKGAPLLAEGGREAILNEVLK